MLFVLKVGSVCGALMCMGLIGTASAQTISRTSTGRSVASGSGTRSAAPQVRYAAPAAQYVAPTVVATPAIPVTSTVVTVQKPVVAETKTQPIATAAAKETPTTASTKDPVAEPAKPAPKPAVVSNGCNSIENEIVAHTNAQRARSGLRPLRIDFGLMNTARAHAGWMARNRSMTHGSYPVAENIAAGQPNAASAMNSWMNSSGHRANIMGGYSSIGVAAVTGANGQTYWCQQFR
ncbi:MAG: CAP domain-containing protein [Pirellulales bacterium]